MSIDKRTIVGLLAVGMMFEGSMPVRHIRSITHAPRKKEDVQPKGTKAFEYVHDFSIKIIYARDQKNADRKARNKGYIK